MPEEAKMAPPLRFQGFSDAWEQRKVFDMSEITFGGGTPKTGNEDYWQGNFPWIQSSDLKNDQLCNVIPTKFITDEAINKSATKAVPANSIAVVTRVGVGKLALMPYPYATSQDFLSLSNLKVDPWFGVYSLYVLIQKEINNIQGTSIKGMTKSDLLSKNIHIPFALDEQTKIGNFFKQLDDTIALHQQKQRQIRSLKQGFIKNLFPNNKNSAPRIRFSIFNDDWNQRNASEIFTSVSDKNYPELPVLSASQEKGMVLRESNGIDIKYDQKSTGTYKRVLPGQFVMHLRSFQGGFAYSTIEGITSPAYTILAFRNKEDHYPLFWKSIFSSKNFIKRLEAITYGIRDGRSISYADFSTLRFWIPSYEEQKQIGDFIESIDATIAFYQRQIDMMQSLKKELLNKMFI